MAFCKDPVSLSSSCPNSTPRASSHLQQLCAKPPSCRQEKKLLCHKHPSSEQSLEQPLATNSYTNTANAFTKIINRQSIVILTSPRQQESQGDVADPQTGFPQKPLQKIRDNTSPQNGWHPWKCPSSSPDNRRSCRQTFLFLSHMRQAATGARC